MARLPRLIIPGQPHHLLLAGTGAEPAFRDDADREAFLGVLRDVAPAHGVALHSYALPAGRVHLLVTPSDAPGLSTMMQALGRRYVAAFNRRHGRRGTLWEGRFRGAMVEAPRYVVPVMQYIEAEVTRADGAERMLDPRVCSLGHHLGLRRDPLLQDPPAYWALGNTPFDRESTYRALVEHGLDAALARRIEDSAFNGWVLASPERLAELGAGTLRPLQRRRPGRPSKVAPVPSAKS